MQQINPQIIDEWKKEGELLAIWRCKRCFKKILLYKTDNPFINSIYLSFANFEKYCTKCLNKTNKSQILKKKMKREIILLRKYEGIDEEEENFLL